MKSVQNPNTLTGNTAVRNPFQQSDQPQQNAQQSSPSPSNGSLTDSSIFLSGQSSLATSPENDVNKNATPNIDVPFDLFSNNSAGPVNFNNISNYTSPLFSTDLFSNSPAPLNRSVPIFGQNMTQSASPVLDTFASTLASLTQGQSPLSLTNGFSTMSSSTFSAPLSTFTPTSPGNLFDMSDPLFNTWRDTSISNGGGGDDSPFDIFDTMFSSMTPGAFNLVDPTGLTDFITDSPITMSPQNQQLTANGERPITCPELWEKVKNHPQFEDIDIDQLCAEMRSKAKVCVLSKSVTPSS